ncbi:50S ribosomal protein L6 [Candidatus Woesearchaeota archaeon]|nr:MAG: 50S ribosomal protein L6 [Candidatus Woesearchaeota archaeon]
MKLDKLEEKIKIPEHCTVAYADYQLTVKGIKSEVVRKIHSPKVQIHVENGFVVFRVNKPSKREKTLLFTYVAHVHNMFKGVTQGHIYKLKVCSGHFPMSVSIKNNVFEIKNFFGAKVPKHLTISKGVAVAVNGNDVTVESSDKELAGQTAASIERLTRRPGFDKRIFQDGIYIVEKDGKAI